ncbi:MAG: lantibiotic dehydratase [Streptosporangiaceae bacterium]
MSGRSRLPGTASTAPFRVGNARLGMARVPVLPDDDPAPHTGAEPVVAEGMFLSSEVHADTSPEDVERRLATTRAFQIRARRRTTPQGVFAAVADLQITDAATSLTVGDVRTRSYPSPAWLHQVLDRTLDSPGVLRGLTFTVNNLVARRGDRLEVERSCDDMDTGPQRMSIRAAEAVDVVMDICRDGASWQQVAAALARERPGVPDGAVDSVLRTMARNEFLLTDLASPPNACDDPIGHVLGKLPVNEPLCEELSGLRAALIEADACPPGHPARMAALRIARKCTDDVAPVWRPVCVDSACDARIRISKDLAEEAAGAASVLWRLTPRHDRLADWHERFLRRYGGQRLVPLLDACDPVTGLGCDVNGPEPPPEAKAAEALAGLLHDALTSGRVEVHLDDATVTALDRRVPGDRPEPSAELYARVVAPTTDRPNSFVLALSGVAAPAGSTRGRFTSLLTGAATEVDAGQGTMTAELAFRPVSHAAAALTGRADGAPWRIPVGVIPQPGDLLLHELAVVSDRQHLSLWSIRHHRPVRPVHHNRLGHHLMPSLAGFLCVLGQHGTVPLSLWTWRPFDRAPFLPRVRWHDTILAPARWKLPDDLCRAARDRVGWGTALHGWRATTRPALPGTVVLDDASRQLPLDLNRHDDRELLRRYVARGVDALTEPPGGGEAVQAVVPGPAGLHGLEIVVPLSADAGSGPAAAPRPPLQARGAGQGLFLPGGEWLSLAVNAPPSTQDPVLERVTVAAHDAAGLWDRWFWLRYHTAERGPHLRVRFHGEPRVLGGQMLPVLRQACATAMSQGLSAGYAVEPYEQEIERYGGHEAIEAAEAIFHHDSELVAAILASNVDADERLALAAVSAAEITCIVADSDRLALAPFHLMRADRRVQARIRPRCRALDDADPPHRSVWETRASALKVYREFVPPSRRIDCASSLIHMHANRILGDNEQERISRALAADLIARKKP